MKLALMLVLCSVALCFGGESKEIKINLSADLGTIIKEKRFSNSEVFIVYIKQKHNTPEKARVEQSLKNDFASYPAELTDCEESGRQAEKYKNTPLEEISRKNDEACIRIKSLQEKTLSEVRTSPIDVQRNIYAILKSLKKDGLEVVGLEGGYANEDDKMYIPGGDSKDIRSSCAKRYPKIVARCEKVTEDIRFESGTGAGQIFEAYYSDDILTVGIENPEVHRVLIQNIGDELSGQPSRLSKEEKKKLEKMREEFVVKTMVEKMKKKGGKFGAIIFGAAHEDTLLVYFEKMGVSYAIIEPAAYKRTKMAQKDGGTSKENNP